ncbi:MAG TPA: hypothetical protein VH877_18385 [Polyangia bacterium]|jgi:hypothetical protein|nr:hypothetical protein [Polyangia bacterium]
MEPWISLPPEMAGNATCSSVAADGQRILCEVREWTYDAWRIENFDGTSTPTEP